MRFCAGVALILTACWPLPAQSPSPKPSVPDPSAAPPWMQKERLTYDIEWRLIHAGTAVVDQEKSHAELRLDSAGMVSALFKIHDVYSADFEEPFCAVSSVMDSQEGKRHNKTTVTYDRSSNRATFVERDLIKDSTLHRSEIPIPNCVHEILGAILKLRSMDIAPGQSAQIAMSDGRKEASVTVEAQVRETVKTPAGSYEAVRYEANMLNGVVYRRKGRALIWLSDDSRRLPVQIRLRMQFPIGTVTLQLVKEENP